MWPPAGVKGERKRSEGVRWLRKINKRKQREQNIKKEKKKIKEECQEQWVL